MSDELRSGLAAVAERLGAPGATFVLERPRDAGHGDLATNLAMVVAKQLKTNPRQLAERVIAELQLPAGVISRTEIAGPGFINFWLDQSRLATQLQEILDAGAAYGRGTVGAGQRVNVEFVSANPTGPLHVGHGRGAALGDAIAELFAWAGYEVEREFYINDAGVQIDRMAQSLWARVQQAVGRPGEVPEGGYHGEYLVEAAAALLEREGRAFADLPAEQGIARCRTFGLDYMHEDQKRDLGIFGVRFQRWSSEQALYDRNAVAETLAELGRRGLTYEEDGAVWLRTTDFGDDQNRVLRKRDGTFTYFLPDIAYHLEKLSRRYDRLVDVWGADHHGYIPRMRAMLRAMGEPDERFEVALVQLVKVVRGGEEVKMSKRAGTFVTLRDLVEEVGTDAARFFFLRLRGDTPLVFDVELAKKQTDENPVFYVQMAHARLSGIFRTAGREPASVTGGADLAALPAPQDLALLKRCTAFPEVVLRAARDREPHQIAQYLTDLATEVHGWYHHTRTVGEPAPTEHARLCLARAARTVLANGLTLLGVSAPDRM